MALVRVVHCLDRNSRQTTIDFLLAFERYGRLAYPDLAVSYLNPIVDCVQPVKVADLTVVFYDFLARRLSPEWPLMRQRLCELARYSRRIVLFPQDDYTHTSEIERLAKVCSADAIYTPLFDWRSEIYSGLLDTVRFEKVLTGYSNLDEKTSHATREDYHRRDIDFGSRVSALGPQFGKAGQLKSTFAAEVAMGLQREGLRVFHSTRPEDVLRGQAWGEFLGRTRSTSVAPGGASILDYEGRLNHRVRGLGARLADTSSMQRWLLRGFEEGPAMLVHGPRLFEAVLAGSVAIIPEEHAPEYFVPFRHFVPFRTRQGFAKILSLLRDAEAWAAIVNAARSLLLTLPELTYRGFVTSFLRRELPAGEGQEHEHPFVADKSRLAALSSLRGPVHQALIASARDSITCASAANVFFAGGGDLSRTLSSPRAETKQAIEDLEEILFLVRQREIPSEALKSAFVDPKAFVGASSDASAG